MIHTQGAGFGVGEVTDKCDATDYALYRSEPAGRFRCLSLCVSVGSTDNLICSAGPQATAGESIPAYQHIQRAQTYVVICLEKQTICQGRGT